MRVNNWKQTILPFFLMLLAVLTDGFLSSYFSAVLNTSFGLMIPRTIILVIIILAFHYKPNVMYINISIIGFIMDAYYLGFLGVYMATFFFLVAIVNGLKRFLNANVLSYTLVSIIGLAASEVFIYGIMRILGITTISFQIFLVSRLGATLLFNAVIMLVFSFFIHRLVVNTLDESETR